MLLVSQETSTDDRLCATIKVATCSYAGQGHAGFPSVSVPSVQSHGGQCDFLLTLPQQPRGSPRPMTWSQDETSSSGTRINETESRDYCGSSANKVATNYRQISATNHPHLTPTSQHSIYTSLPQPGSSLSLEPAGGTAGLTSLSSRDTNRAPATPPN